MLAADYEEAWYIETAGGHHWMALRVPHDSFFVSANQGRFQVGLLGQSGARLCRRVPVELPVGWEAPTLHKRAWLLALAL